ncbi:MULTISPECIES: ATP-dependent Clp protease ATP-binding subunit [unclassified Aureispira]|uniref:ATP-dependent Clp protease ATP-binding subunit n=1 Tax=unclassified Aureispira TaxID=2649989 RepID=UPI00069656BB|nr:MULTISPECIES: AAA family ATPase [unclassified Aureispira]WMX14781.1 AAA family ATPase [Aureispira sp. CCB-E]
MFDKLTEKARQSILKAQEYVRAKEQQDVQISHLLKGMMDIEDSIVLFLLKKISIDIGELTNRLSLIMETYPKVYGGNNHGSHLSTNASKAIQAAQSLAKDMGDEYVALDMILAGIFTVKNDKTVKLLASMGTNEKDLGAAIKELRKGKNVNTPSGENEFDALNKYAVNLNERARTGKLDRIIGRDEEIRRILHILSRRKKNNPIIIGEAGVGKTAIVEGLAWRIVDNDIPDNLQGKTLFSLDMAALVAGAKYKGEFEERLKAVVKEVTTSDDVILFIDEIHTLVGAGGGGGGMDAANILKPALARGELRTIGATTLDEYRRYIEKDKALERRFQKVKVEEPTVAETIAILRGLRDRYETHHKVRILDSALIAAAEMSKRYVSDRALPDKAIDLIDEAAAKLRLELSSVPEELDALERKKRQLEIEKEVVKRDGTKSKIGVINKQLAEISEDLLEMKSAWESEKELINIIQSCKAVMEEFRIEAEEARRNGDYAKVAELEYGKIKEQEDILKNAQADLDKLAPEKRMTDGEVDESDVADVVSRWTGIPVSKMMESEREKLLKMEEKIGERLIGQVAAVKAVSDAVRRSRSGLQDTKKPIGSFIFMGTTGVGKTELAKALAEYLFNDENAITRLDMSEYMEKHAVARLVGPPPGYVGYEEGGQLTNAVREKPYSIVLLDEIEKAHPDTFNILLQVLDDGRLTDNKGRVADFKNTIIIMTTNMGSNIIYENFDGLDDVDDKKRQEIIDATQDEVIEALKDHMRPEFLNRIDEQVMFTPLNKEEIKKIMLLMFKSTRKRVQRQGYDIELSNKAIDFLAEKGYEPQYGARPMKRVLQRDVDNELSKHLLSGEFDLGDVIYVDVSSKKELTFTKKKIEKKVPKKVEE